MDRPLISFILMCYNQEDYIRDAVAGALAQDYSPLEIIICDDCSGDRTFEIAQEVISEYHGPHHVRLYRNENNKGLAGNTNQALGMSRGELIVLAAGDDISLPERTRMIAEAWDNSRRQALILCSLFST